VRASSWKHALPTPHAPPADFLSRGRTCEWARVRAHAALQPRDRRSARAVHRKRRSRAVTPPPFLSTRPPARPQLALGTQSHRRAGGCGRGWRWTERVAKWRGHAWAAAAMGGRKSNAALSSPHAHHPPPLFAQSHVLRAGPRARGAGLREKPEGHAGERGEGEKGGGACAHSPPQPRAPLTRHPPFSLSHQALTRWGGALLELAHFCQGGEAYDKIHQVREEGERERERERRESDLSPCLLSRRAHAPLPSPPFLAHAHASSPSPLSPPLLPLPGHRQVQGRPGHRPGQA